MRRLRRREVIGVAGATTSAAVTVVAGASTGHWEVAVTGLAGLQVVTAGLLVLLLRRSDGAPPASPPDLQRLEEAVTALSMRVTLESQALQRVIRDVPDPDDGEASPRE